MKYLLLVLWFKIFCLSRPYFSSWLLLSRLWIRFFCRLLFSRDSLIKCIFLVVCSFFSKLPSLSEVLPSVLMLVYSLILRIFADYIAYFYVIDSSFASAFRWYTPLFNKLTSFTVYVTSLSRFSFGIFIFEPVNFILTATWLLLRVNTNNFGILVLGNFRFFCFIFFKTVKFTIF